MTREQRDAKNRALRKRLSRMTREQKDAVNTYHREYNALRREVGWKRHYTTDQKNAKLKHRRERRVRLWQEVCKPHNDAKTDTQEN